MNVDVAAVLWTLAVLLLIRPSLLEGFLLAILLVPTFSILSSYRFPLFERWPLLQPSSVPMTILAALLVIVAAAYRYRRRHRSINDRNA